jgi:hypothetical protein
MTIITLFNTCVSIIFLNDYFKKTYPEKYNDFFIALFFEFVYIYSQIQLLFNKLKVELNKYELFNVFISKLNSFYRSYNNNQIFELEFILNGEIILKESKQNFKNINKELVYDFIIYSDYSENNTCINKKIIKSVTEINDENELCYYELSDIKFLLCEIKIGEKLINVAFKNDVYDFYIVNNIIDINFMKYFLNNYYKNFLEDINIANENIELHILDNNVNKVVLNDKNNMIIEKDRYIIR